jgi:hypothetical protein
LSLNKDGRTAGEADKAEAHEGRCPCGSLLFVKVKGGIEIKCRKCKRTQFVKL